ncbi:hypothetical protein [Streptomyces beihaiensis]|uniref:Uncharacterized protein n=1 Tax=Streptomyces beihaiensis TaxID=2984495 RepID=A0ABT3TT42_9ACTN|nr:hypothetical protein [Streptomyces beihaiensis]MCX3059592.1 hypothetical protein [Streptomyces beihaiensis]
MTPAQVLTVSALGGFAAVLGLSVLAVVALCLFAAATRLVEVHERHRHHRRALKDGRRRLETFTTIDDLKD